MRVAIVDTYYLPFLTAHYRAEPGLARAGYRQQHQALMARYMGTSDAYSHYLRECGHEAVELVANCPQLQSAWAREHAGSLVRAIGRAPGRVGRQALLHSVLHAQIRALDPDVVYIQDMRLLTRPELDLLRRRGRLVVGQIASAAPGTPVVRGYDLIVTSFPHFVARFAALGVEAEYLPLAFDARLSGQLAADGIDTAATADRPDPVTFVGGVTAEHDAGTATLERLAEEVPLAIWGYGADELPPDSVLRSRHRGEAWGADMYRILARSQIVVNRHIRSAAGHANNMRMFEATGMGALLITEDAPNLPSLFKSGKEVVSYRDGDQLIALTKRYLADAEDRVSIAQAGQRRTVAEHDYRARIGELAEILERRLSSRR
jgi:spore maturation protein CgeB